MRGQVAPISQYAAVCDQQWHTESGLLLLAGVDLDKQALDSTIVKFHAHGTGAPKKRGARRLAARSAA